MALEGHRRTSDTVPTPRSPEDGLDHEEMEFTEGEGIGRGVLSRTLIQSPTIHAILPGKIRHKDQNDVIFVGERSIQILELQRTGYLEEVAMKTDFASNILAAKVIGSSEQEVEDFVDAVVKQEHSPSDEEMQSDSDSVELPPQLLALVLDSKEVLFLWARNTRYGSVDFQVSRRSLPVEIASLSRYGELLAVDGRSRALALGSSLGHFAVMSLKSTEHMKNDLYTNGHDGAVMPITEVCWRQCQVALDADFYRNASSEWTDTSSRWTFSCRQLIIHGLQSSFSSFRRTAILISSYTNGIQHLAYSIAAT